MPTNFKGYFPSYQLSVRSKPGGTGGVGQRDSGGAPILREIGKFLA